ncbi:hypothetical protein [Streptomyces sp. 8N706]|uniref:hypothetical protein n=1 Tax=Streptomyces sp. 8N706 TaxID=3457416 RepID=UPI003FD267DB
MSTGAIIILAVAAAVIVALVLARPVLQSSGNGLRRRFGPEYDRAVARHDGDTKAAHKELSERLRRHGDLRLHPLSGESREQYVAQWAGVQEQFVDSPATAVAEADQLLGRLVRDRGYPADAYDEQTDALSVHHAHHVGGYRQLHLVARRAREGEAHTEQLREALIGARALFEELVKAHPRDDGGRDRPDARRTAGGRGASRKPLAGRLHLPWATMGGHGHGTTKGGV